MSYYYPEVRRDAWVLLDDGLSNQCLLRQVSKRVDYFTIHPLAVLHTAPLSSTLTVDCHRETLVCKPKFAVEAANKRLVELGYSLGEG